MNPKQFLMVGGMILLAVGVLGYAGVIGPTSADSIFGENWYFDNAENLAHTVLGIAALASALVLPALWQRYLVVGVGAIGIVVGIYGFAQMSLLGAMLQNPGDNLLHLVVGAWAMYAALNPRAAEVTVSAGRSSGV